jgi:23S rRNA pseudouridine1911/1915/1917 synthase
MTRDDSERCVDLTLPDGAAGRRLDRVLAGLIDRLSRTQIAKLITAGEVQVDGVKSADVKASLLVEAGMRVAVHLPSPPPSHLIPEPIPFDVIFEDEALAAVNKPAGVVTHPSTTQQSGTLAHGLAHRFAELSNLYGDPTRVGIVHRLDRDTSGVILIAKDEVAHRKLAEQFERRLVRKHYVAVVHRDPPGSEQTIDAAIARDPQHPALMTVAPPGDGREARTRIVVAERFGGKFARVDAWPATGRTHQIRVHLRHIGHPVVADRLYAADFHPWTNAIARRAGDPAAPVMPRQALHAAAIAFAHPHTGEPMELAAPWPDDLTELVAALRTRYAGETTA